MDNINLNTRRTLVESLNQPEFKTAVEVGVCKGWFSKYILDNTKMKLFSIDPWEDNPVLSDSQNVYKECKERLAPYGDRNEMIKGCSPEESKPFEDESLDFVYIDGMHDYISVKQDMDAWWPKLRTGGFMAGHDFNAIEWNGVVLAVSQFVQERNLSFFLTGKVGNAWESLTGGIDEFDGDQQSWVISKPALL